MIPQYEPFIGKDEKEAILKYMNSGGWLTEFDMTRLFEDLCCYEINKNHCYTMPNGTISLSIALKVMGIEPGDKVLVPGLSMIATANAVKFIGAEPIFAEIEEDSLCLDVDKTIKFITDQNERENFGRVIWSKKSQHNKTKYPEIQAVIYVSLNGRHSKNIEKLIDYCNENNIIFIEDAAQSFGSKPIDAPISSYSFSMPKIITMGQGGLLATNNIDIAEKIKKYRDFGRESGGNDIHDEFGINCKFTDLQSVIGLSQLKNIRWRISKKKKIYNKYFELLKDVKQIYMIEPEKDVTPWFVDIYLNDRDKLINFLKDNKIGTRKIYPPMYSQKCYDLDLGYRIIEMYSSMGLWLPSSLNLREADIKFVCNQIKGFYNDK